MQGSRFFRCPQSVTLLGGPTRSYNGSIVGTSTVKFTVSHPLSPDQRMELDGLVDTGALFTQIPADMLSQIGIAPSGSRSAHYADGTRAYHTARQIDGCPSDNTDYIYGTNGWCEVNGWKPTYLSKDYEGKTIWEHKRPKQADINDALRSMTDALRGTPASEALDPQGALVDGDMGAYYTWLNQTRLSGAITAAFLAWFENHSDAVLISASRSSLTASAT